jgi:ribonuclease D
VTAAESDIDTDTDTDAHRTRQPATDFSPDAGLELKAAPEPASGRPPTPLREPREGVPVPITTHEQLAAAAAELAAGTGPVAVDAERASGYRYGQRAYLVQLRRDGAGTFLIDPVGVPDLTVVGEALAGIEWVLHAANQDLPGLAQLGMRPDTLFDTELASRLLGLPRVGLGAVIEEVLGLRLDKEHSAVDWSTRPLPESWLRYAALDVEVLVELRDALRALLVAQGKVAWAEQEFAALAAAPPPSPREDPWRRTSGLHRVRKRRQVAGVRELWIARDRLARERDTAPGRVLPDAAIIEAAMALPETEDALVALPAFRGRGTRRRSATWFGAIDKARRLAETALPPASLPSEGPPPVRSWGERDPLAAARLCAARTAVAARAAELGMPTENLLSPDALRRVVWSPPQPVTEISVAAALHALGSRPWQVELTAPLVTAAIASVTVPQPAQPPVGEGDPHP